MAWTERQKAQGKEELLRRRTYETAATYRKSFYAAASWCIACLLAVILALLVAKTPDWMTRSSGIYLACIALIGLAVNAILSYVRYLDWRRRSVSERNDSLQTE
jgi:hypothetical protein